MAFQTQTEYDAAIKQFATYDERAANSALTVNDVLAEQVRAKRDELLRASDWTQLPDTPTDKQAWATYRQALRDLPSVAGFPTNFVMPTAPTL